MLIRVRVLMVLLVTFTWVVVQLVANLHSSSSGGIGEELTAIFDEQGWTKVIFVLLSTSILSVVYSWLLQRFPNHVKTQAYVQLSGDLLLTGALIITYGGIESPFSALYPLIVVLAALHLGPRRIGTTFATAALAIYATILLVLHVGLEGSATEEQNTRLVYNLVIALFGFYAAAALGSQLARRGRATEAALVSQKERFADLEVEYHDVVQSIGSGLITTDEYGFMTSINHAGQQILHVDAEQLISESIVQTGLFGEAEWQKIVHEGGSPPGERKEVQLDLGDREAFVGYSVSPLNDATGTQTGFIVVFQDFTETRELERELNVRDRMAAVGQLAAGLAHELGNPLAAISGSAQMLSQMLPESVAADSRRLVGLIHKESQRLDRTVKSFLKFARPRERSPERFDIATMLTEHFELLSHSPEVSPKHHLELDLDIDSAQAFADPDQISQVFWNLVRNALKAMPDGGTLRVIGRDQGHQGYCLSIADSGCGMTEEELEQLFDPFHSLFGDGLGIGMAIVYRIVTEHGGRLHSRSRPGHGTTIIVELPPESQVRSLPPRFNTDAPMPATRPSTGTQTPSEARPPRHPVDFPGGTEQ